MRIKKNVITHNSQEKFILTIKGAKTYSHILISLSLSSLCALLLQTEIPQGKADSLPPREQLGPAAAPFPRERLRGVKPDQLRQILQNTSVSQNSADPSRGRQVKRLSDKGRKVGLEKEG